MPYTIFFDTETGGVEPQHPTIQLAAIAVDDRTWAEVAAFECKIKFAESSAQDDALKMNHYSREAWASAVDPRAVPPMLSKFSQPFRSIEMTSKRTGAPYQVSKLAGHNALTFDLPRLRALYGAEFFPFSYHVKDTLQRALWYFDEHPELKRPKNLKLSVLCAYFGISSDVSHEALTDVRLSARLAQALSGYKK